MAISIKWNVVKGAGFRVSGGFDEIHHVYGLDTSRPGDLRLQDAAYARDATTGRRIPAKGDAHPRIPNAVVDDVKADAFLNAIDKAKVTVTYKTSPAGKTPQGVLEDGGTLIRLNNTLVAVTSSFDADGNPLAVFYDTVSWETSRDTEFNTNTGGGLFTILANYGRAQAREGASLLEFIRLEDKNPKKKNIDHRGKRNHDTFQGDPPRTWLCIGIGGSYALPDTTVRGAPKPRWEVHYQFESEQPHNVTGHEAPRPGDVLLLFVDQRTGQTPPNVDVVRDFNRGFGQWGRELNGRRHPNGNGWGVFEMQKTTPFGGLKLPDISKF